MTSSVLMNTYGRQPISFSRGEGVYLYDEADKRYIDAISGIGVNALGHSHPAVTSALCEQAGRLMHTSNLYGIATQQRLAETLCRLSGMDNVFFSNSGAEANEAAIKIARLYAHQRGVENPCIVVMEQAFHGRTLATLSASGNRKIQAGFEPLVGGFIRVPFGDFDALQTLSADPQVAAVLLEPIQGEGGLHILPQGFLTRLRQLCDEHQWLLMLDEVQTGNGRTGRYFAFQHEGITPDVLTTAKGLGNGMPIGACLAHGAAAKVFAPGNHGSTFGGSPLACAVAQAVLHTIESEQLCEHAAELGQYMRAQFQNRLQDCHAVIEVRGQGLMIGIELDRPCAALVEHCRERGVLINVTAERIVRLLPPLICQTGQADEIIDAVSAAIIALTAV